MFWFSLILMVLVGVSLGLLGSGGSILTLPILIYVAEIDPFTATSYTLFIVGISAIIGSLRNIILGLVDFKITIYFGIPSLISVYFTRYFILPALPETILEWNGFVISKDVIIILFLAILMIFSSYSMIRKNNPVTHENEREVNLNVFLILIQGIVVGFVTGFVGAGGGFLIVPALLFFCKLPVKKAVGTSLAIIAINTTVGFTGDIIKGIDLNWLLLTAFTVSALIGTVLGSIISKSIKENQLKIIFGWFILLMGVFIFVKELFL